MRIHGRGGVAYMSLTSGGAASPVAFLSDWTVEYALTVFDVTAVTDAQRIYVASIPDVTGRFTGFYDTATVQSYQAAADGLPRSLYLYPGSGLPGTFFSGPVLPDYSIGGGTSSAVALSVTWAATSLFARTDNAVSGVNAGLAPAAGTAGSAAVTIVPGFSSVPGRAVPGQFTPGLPGSP